MLPYAQTAVCNMNNNDAQSVFDIPVAPTFYPTESEFEDPWRYLKSIQSEIEKVGICVIQPPVGKKWDFQSFFKHVNTKKFSFTTKAQNVHQMQNRSGPNVQFISKLKKFWSEKGQPLTLLPEVDGLVLDLYKLLIEVERLGGFEKIQNDFNSWLVILKSLRLLTGGEDNQVLQNLCGLVRDNYVRVVKPFVEVLSKDTDNENCKKRKLDDSSETPDAKRQRTSEPLWSQVRSRSFSGFFESLEKEKCDEKSKNTGASSKEDEDEEQDITQFGYGTGRTYTLQEFEIEANKFEKRWQYCSSPFNPEREYWRLIESGEEFVQVGYGSDLDVGVVGSGFPTKDEWKKKSSEYMASSGWNTNNLSDATYLNHIGESVGGVTRPMIYVGMLFSSFCWHTEDNYLYSVNYLHTGKPKRWYGVPSNGADAFEKSMRKNLPLLFQKNPNLLHLLVTQLTPRTLKEEGVPVYTALQKTGMYDCNNPIVVLLITTFPWTWYTKE
eukprot:TRINITY_DN2479_c0_g1_i2.p1 TRINITY_DN2479_c0_g1~~TRINITY_DN2479_c0_g1_i2.p1  ORF type:complete len:495 (+),score=57.94 TRINITY_DN2479_c0_g1_i2:67-1551(+)